MKRMYVGAAYLSELFKSEGVSTCVVSVPFGIDGAMANKFVETSVGFDTACKVSDTIL